MKPVAIWTSIVLHIVILIASYFDFHNFLNKQPIKDTGHVVFDFVKIGNKSKAPILSTDNAKASRKKSHTDEKLDNKDQEQNSRMQSTQTQPEQTDTEQKKDEKHITKKVSDNKHSDNNSKDKKTPVKKDKKSSQSSSKISNKKTNKNSKTKVSDVQHQNNSSKKQSNKNTDKKQSKKTTTMQTNKKDTKSGTKALVDKTVKNKKVSNIKQGEKGAFDSLIDNALADGNYENSGLNAEEVGDTLTATQIDLVRETIRPCWHFPAGLKNAETLIVDIKMELNHDGYVTSAKIVDTARLKKDTDFRTAAESALRAVLDPACNPLPLPKEKYNEWKDLELSFNPKDWM